MTIKLAVIMDPIASIHYKKDTTLAMLWEAEKRGWEVFYLTQRDLFIRDGDVFANCHALKVFHDPNRWYELGEAVCLPVTDFDTVLMRKDPPFDMEYVYSTYLLELAEKKGVLIVNKPQSLRDCNEKFFTTWFPQCCPSTIITRDMAVLRNFFTEQKDIVCKPLDGMGGQSVFRLKYPDENASVVFETLTQHNHRMTLAQRYIPEIKQGDKRIILIDGEPVSHCLARIPPSGELRGNLAAGGKGVAQPLSDHDRWICQEIGPVLREKGLLFVGVDIIGDYLTEINVTSPTCLREIEEQTGISISAQFFDCIEKYLSFS